MTALITNRQERLRFVKFMVVGAIGSVVDFLVMNLLTKLAGFSLSLAGTISFICAVFSNFTWNRYWTYPDSRAKPLGRQLMMFFVVNVAGVVIRIPILHYLEPVVEKLLANFPSKIFSVDFLAKNLTLTIAIGIVMLWNYFINRYWTYNDAGVVKPQ